MRDVISNLVALGAKARSWKLKLLTAAKLQSQKFGRSNRDHSATQEACGETTLYLLL
jgi:hypothetical protein